MHKSIGTSDNETCECCGKTGLKRTILVATCDADGNIEYVQHMGTVCAARKCGLRHGTKIAAEKAVAEQIQAHRDSERQRIFETECWLHPYFNCYIPNDIRLSQMPGDTPEARVNAAVALRNERFPILKG